MSFNAKNLAYESKTPAFLRRLQAELGGNTIDRPSPRPRKAPREDDEDDEPTYVIGGNETITSEEFRAMNEGTITDLSKEESDTGAGADGKVKWSGDKDAIDTSSKEKKGNERTVEIGIGNQKKRKAAKIIGDQDEASAPAKDSKIKAGEASKEGNPSTASTKKVKKQKKSAVKLSFGDEGE